MSSLTAHAPGHRLHSVAERGFQGATASNRDERNRPIKHSSLLTAGVGLATTAQEPLSSQAELDPKRLLRSKPISPRPQLLELHLCARKTTHRVHSGGNSNEIAALSYSCAT